MFDFVNDEENSFFITDEVCANGIGAVDMERLERSIDQTADTYEFTNRPAAADVFDSQYLPAKADREEGWTIRLHPAILHSEPYASADLGAASDVTAKSMQSGAASASSPTPI